MSRVLRILALTCLLAGLGSGPAAADKMTDGKGHYVVGVPSEQFVHFAAPEGTGRQRMQNWCWAACIQMVLNYHGLYITQEEIVSRVFGATIDRPAGPQEILSALSGWVPDTRGGYSEIMADSRNLDPISILEDLEYRWPLIVGLGSPYPGQQGHAYVLTAAYYYLDQSGSPVIYQVVLRDPYPTQASKLEMSAQEFAQRCTFATRVHVIRH